VWPGGLRPTPRLRGPALARTLRGTEIPVTVMVSTFPGDCVLPLAGPKSYQTVDGPSRDGR